MKQGSVLIDALLADAPGELVLVRHGQQGPNNLNDPMRPYGGDVSLSELGTRQADATARTLAAEPLAAVYTSPMLRAAETAAAVAAAQGLAAVSDPDLVEISGYRDLPAGTTVAQLLGAAGVEALRDKMIRERRWDGLPYSEPGPEFRARVLRALGRICSAHPEHARVAVVCHAGVINTVVSHVLGMSTDLVAFMSHASVTRIARGDGRLAVRAVNQDQHLRDAGLHSW